MSIKVLPILLNFNKLKIFSLSIVLLWLTFLISTYINYNPNYFDISRSVLQRILIYFVFFLVVYNELEQNCQLQNIIQRTICFSIIVMGFSYFTGIGAEYKLGRLWIFGTDANTIGVWSSIIIVMTFDLIVNEKTKVIKLVYYIAVIAISMLLIVFTGSRKAIILMAFGVLVYYIFLNRSFNYKLKLLIPFILFCFIAFGYVSTQGIIRERFMSELERQDLGGRMPIWEATIEIIQKNPFFGVGIGEFANQIEFSLGRVRAVHNEFLTVLVYGGIVGLIWFLLFLYYIGRKAFLILRIKNSSFTSLPIALFCMQILFLFSAGGALTSFISWFIYAYILVKTHEDKPKIYSNININISGSNY